MFPDHAEYKGQWVAKRESFVRKKTTLVRKTATQGHDFAKMNGWGIIWCTTTVIHTQGNGLMARNTALVSTNGKMEFSFEVTGLRASRISTDKGYSIHTGTCTPLSFKKSFEVVHRAQLFKDFERNF